jgi:hypothetical protein
MKPIKQQKKFIILGIAFSLLLLACFSFFFAFLSLNTNFTLQHFPNPAGTIVGGALILIFSLTACLCFVLAIIFLVSVFQHA